MSKITVETNINVPVQNVWEYFTKPEHITKWNFASDDWCSPRAENDLRVGGSFSYRMEAKDGSFGFDFGGTYDEVVPLERIAYTLGGDSNRKVVIVFESDGDKTHVTETFDPETINPEEMQRNGWQAILDNFKKHSESQ